MTASPRAGRLLDGDVEETILDATTPNLGATVVRQDAFLPFDETFPASADVEWWIRISQSAQVRTVPHVSHIMRRHSGPRVLNSREARIRATLRMLDLHSDWFECHPRALAFRYYSLGIKAASSGDYRLARRSFLRSAGLKPTAQGGQAIDQWCTTHASGPGLLAAHQTGCIIEDLTVPMLRGRRDSSSPTGRARRMRAALRRQAP